MRDTNIYDASGRHLARIESDGSVSRIYDRGGNYIGRFEKSSGLIFNRTGRTVAKAVGDISNVIVLLLKDS